jgi:hypothetical protein
MAGMFGISLTSRQIGLGVLLFVLPGWLFAGWGLMYLGARFLARAPKATWLRSLLAHVLGASGAVLVFGWFVIEVAAGTRSGFAFGFALLLGGSFAIGLWWGIIAGVFDMSPWRAILAWLPQLLILALLAGALVCLW